VYIIKLKDKNYQSGNVGMRGAGLFNSSFAMGMVVGKGGAIQSPYIYNTLYKRYP